MSDDPGIFLGLGEQPVYALPQFGNRHGLIAGATGTGKTVTLQVLAEGFASLGVPVFMADVKGDLSGMCMPGGGNPKLEERAKQIGLDPYTYTSFPVRFWDVFGELGHPIRATISEMGPLLLSRLMNLNPTQEGVLTLAFRVADDEGLLLLDLKDLRSMLTFVADNAAELKVRYGNVSAATVGTIQRELLTLESQNAELFFGEPALDLQDFLAKAPDGRGYVNIIESGRLIQSPRTYATFLLWLLSELFEELPEVGDQDRPRLIFFFDEAHLLFSDAPPALLNKVEQVVMLIRSKGVGVWFCTQNPLDIPDAVLGQLGNRVQHALRAFTPRDQKAVKSAATTFRQNPAFSTEEVITQLGVGEALVSMLEAKGTPMIVQRTLIRPPASRLGPADEMDKRSAIEGSPVFGKYEKVVDRESAYELLNRRAEQEAAEVRSAQAEKERAKQERATPSRRSDTPLESMVKSLLRSAGSNLGRAISRGILGGLTRRR
jgi:DNA helicase HerA-like ATPase